MDEPQLEPPRVTLGALEAGGLAPAILAIVERGVLRRPELARMIMAEVELLVDPAYPPVRLCFAAETVIVEDAPAEAPDLRVRGELADLIALLVAPAIGGVPLPFTPRGLAAIGMVASRRVRVHGRVRLLRRLLTVIRI